MKYLTAIIITEPQPTNQATALKYHNIPDTPDRIDKFLKFAGRFPGCKECNFYFKRKPNQARGVFKEKFVWDAANNSFTEFIPKKK